MRVVCLILSLVAATESAVSVYLLDFNSGKVLTATGATIQFSPQIFGNKSQLWQFTKEGDVILSLNSQYLGLAHTTQTLELVQTPNVTWYWEDMKIRAEDQSPSNIVCIGPNPVQVVACDQGANITLQVYESEVFDIAKAINTLIANNNLTSTKQAMLAIDSKLNITQKNLTDWNTDMTQYIEDFKNISKNIASVRGSLDIDIGNLHEVMTTLKSSVQNITSHLNSTDIDFSALDNALNTYKTSTNKSIADGMTRIRGELERKATNGHIIPDNVYEFTILFLLALGIINLFDISRRLIAYAIDQKAPVKYGTE